MDLFQFEKRVVRFKNFPDQRWIVGIGGRAGGCDRPVRFRTGSFTIFNRKKHLDKLAIFTRNSMLK